MNNDVTYIKCCVLANGITDTSDDVLIRQEIKRIKTNTKNLNFDIGHNNHYLHGIEIVETYINQSDEYINKTLIPSGSWIMVLAIYNQTIRDMINEGSITGVSLRTELGEKVKLYDPPTTSGRVDYNNIQNKEEMQPSSISFTEDPANMMPIEVMSYEAYTAKDNKNNTNGENMTEQNNNQSEVGFWRSLFREGLFTAKDVEPQPQPVNGVLDGVNMDEFMQTFVDSQKSIPQMNELLQKIVENQQKQTEQITQFTSQLEQFKLDLAEFKQEIAGKVDEGIVAGKEKEAAQETKTEENKEEKDDDKDKTSAENKEAAPAKEEDKKIEEEVNSKDNIPIKTEKEASQNDDEVNVDADEKEVYTAKTSKPLTTISQQSHDEQMEGILRFIAENSYDALMKKQ